MDEERTSEQQGDLRSEADRLLVEQLRQGSAEAATALDRQYREPLLRFCVGYLGQMEEAEDVVQEVFLRVLRSPNVPDYFRAWVYRIARNQCQTILRSRPAGTLTGNRSTQMSASMTGQLTRMVRNELRERMTEAFGRLAEHHREALRLRYVEGLSRVEIAHVLDLTEQVVKSRLYEGICKLREEAERTGSS